MGVKNKPQKASGSFINLQAESLAIHTGLSVGCVKELTLEMF